MVSRRGVKYLIDTTDDVQQMIFLNAYETAELRMLPSLIKTGCCCFDVGANVGFFALHMAKLVGHSGRIFAFEPNPENVVRLRTNVDLNQTGDIIEICPLALTDQRGSIAFHKSEPGHSGWGSLVKYADLKTLDIRVAADSLDEFCAERRVYYIDFLKADVEGAEFEFLAGARRMLRGQMIKHILIEFNGPRMAERGHTLEEMCDLFAEFGYVLSNKEAVVSQKLGKPRDSIQNLLFTIPAETT